MKTAALARLRADLHCLASPAKALAAARFFKTGPGQYGAGDVFIGVTVPENRRAIKPYLQLPQPDLAALLDSKIHEERLAALLILAAQFQAAAKAGDAKAQQTIVAFYLARTDRVNNWDLVDASAHQILGEHLVDKDRRLLARLAKSPNMWERRIAMVSTFAFIKRGESADACAIAEKLLADQHDLMHKAVGWMLREVGKRAGLENLRLFLRQHAKTMPRTALRYAIEKMEVAERRRWLAGQGCA